MNKQRKVTLEHLRKLEEAGLMDLNRLTLFVAEKEWLDATLPQEQNTPIDVVGRSITPVTTSSLKSQALFRCHWKDAAVVFNVSYSILRSQDLKGVRWIGATPACRDALVEIDLNHSNLIQFGLSPEDFDNPKSKFMTMKAAKSLLVTGDVYNIFTSDHKLRVGKKALRVPSDVVHIEAKNRAEAREDHYKTYPRVVNHSDDVRREK